MQTSRHQGLYFIILIVNFGVIGLAAPTIKKQTNVKEATNSAVPIDEEQTSDNAAASLTARENKAKADAFKKIEEAPTGRVSSTARKTTKDLFNFKHTVRQTVYSIRMRRQNFAQYPGYAPGPYAPVPYAPGPYAPVPNGR